MLIHLTFILVTTITFLVYYRKKVGFSFSKNQIKGTGIFTILIFLGIVFAVAYAHYLTNGVTSSLIGIDVLISQTNIFLILTLSIIFGIIWGCILANLMQYLSRFIKSETFDLKLMMVLVVVFLAFTVNHIITIPLLMLFSSIISVPLPESNIVHELFFVLGSLEQYLTVDYVAVFNIVMQFWIPVVFFIYFLKDIKNSEKKISEKLINLVICFSVLIVISLIANENTLHFSSQGESAAFQATFVNWMIIAIIIIGFLTAKGFITTFQKHWILFTNQNRILQNTKSKISQNISFPKKAWVGLMLFINIFGFLQFFLLLAIPIGFNPIFDFVLDMSYYIASNVHENIRDQAIVVSSIFIVFFNFFVVYGLLMLLRGYGNQFLTKNNKVYLFFESRIGPNTAITSIALITVFMGGGLMLSNNLIGMISILPDWVQQELGYNQVIASQEFDFLRDSSKTVGLLFFFKGMGFAIGVGHTVISNYKKNKKLS